MTDNKRILDKIQKCLALAESNNPHEAAQALKQAKKLMELYNIHESELAILDITESDPIKFKSGKLLKIKDYEHTLFNLINLLFGVKTLIRSDKVNSGNYCIFIGNKTDILVAEYAVAMLLRLIKTARKKYLTELGEIEEQKYEWLRMTPHQRQKSANDYCSGWILGVYQELKSLAKYRGIEEEANNAKLKEYIDQKMPSVRNINPRNKKVVDKSWYEGYRDGINTDINLGVAGGGINQLSLSNTK